MAIETTYARRPLIYLGLVDDRVHAYPWSRQGVTLAAINEALIASALVGDPVLINDGYLINNPNLFPALLSHARSPLRHLIQVGYAIVLTRNGENLHRLAEEMDEAGVGSFGETMKQGAWDRDMLRLAGDLSLGGRLNVRWHPWPKIDMSEGLHRLLSRVADHPNPADLGLVDDPDSVHPSQALKGRDKVHLLDAVVRGYLDKFKDQKIAATRTKWEESLNEQYESNPGFKKRFRSHCMHLANEAYHYNFTACLQAESSATYKVCTRHSPWFGTWRPTPPEAREDIYEALHEHDLDLRLPPDIPISSGSFLAEVVAFSDRLVSCKESYVYHYDRFVRGESQTPQHVLEARDEYRAALIEHHRRPRKSDTFSDVSRTVLETMSFGMGVSDAVKAIDTSSLAITFASKVIPPVFSFVYRRAAGGDVKVPSRVSTLDTLEHTPASSMALDRDIAKAHTEGLTRYP